MAKIEVKHLHVVKAKGKEYAYAWRGGPRIHGVRGSQEFLNALAEAQASRNKPDKSRIAGLITAYKSSDEWRDGVGESTKKLWSPWLDRIQAEFGKLGVAAFRRPDFVDDIKKWRNTFKENPRKADTGMQVLSVLLAFGRVSPNPCSFIANLYDVDRSEIIWTYEDLTALEKVASPEVMWAARLGALTGLRQADCKKLLWNEIGEFAIDTVADKSGKKQKRYIVPLYQELKDLLATIPKRSTQVLTNTRGVPWKTGLSDSFGDAARAAGIDKHFHDLRGTAATRFYEAEFSMRQIATILAWEEAYVEKIIGRYVNRDAVLLQQIERLNRTTAERKV